MSELLREIRASNPVAEELVETIEIEHPGLGSNLRFARSYIDFVADTEQESSVTFLKSAIQIELPKKGVTGNQDLIITIDNVAIQSWQYARDIQVANRYSRSNTVVTARIYALSNTSAALETYQLDAKRITSENSVITILSGYKELLNRSAFTRRYNSQDHPGLKYQ